MANNTPPTLISRRRLLLSCLALFVLAFAVRTLTWQDNRLDAWKVQTSVTHRYKESARQLVNGQFKTFLTDVPRLGHPPGYPIVLATVYLTVGESDTALQFLQITVDSASVVLLFLISLELFSLSVSLLAGVLAALSPQFAYFSVLLLPDSLVVLPILLALYLIVKSRQRFNWWRLLIAGVFIGVSCWLRANALFLPVFVGVAAALTTSKGKRVSAAVAVLAGAVIAIAPITIKNAIVFHAFIPLSLGSGQTLLEGLADYDPKGTLNIPNTDLGLTRQEADWYGRPDYADGLFNVDGIERDRMRVRRGLTTIAQHPFWFAGVMGKRALASTRLDPVPPLRAQSPLSHPVDVTTLKPIWSEEKTAVWPTASIVWVTHNQSATRGFYSGYAQLRIEGANQPQTKTIPVSSFHDFVFEVPIQVLEGRIELKVISGGKVLGSTIVETDDQSGYQQGINVELPFVSGNNSELQLAIANSASAQSKLTFDRVRLFDVGPSSLTWLRFVRAPLRFMQTVFKTAWTIPVLILGIGILIQRKQLPSLILLFAVPAYYLIVQSALHTERRYVYVIHFFFLVIVSVALCWVTSLIIHFVARRASTS